MAKNENKTITVNEVEHNIEDLTEQQIAMVNHIADLDKKLGNLMFNIDQLKVGREAFVNMLASSFEDVEEVAEEQGNTMEEEAKTVMDSLAVGGTVATLAGWLPSVASLFTIIWLSLRIWESETVKKLFKRDK